MKKLVDGKKNLPCNGASIFNCILDLRGIVPLQHNLAVSGGIRGEPFRCGVHRGHSPVHKGADPDHCTAERGKDQITLTYKATPLISNNDDNGHGFIIYFKYPASEPTSTATINVLTDKNTTYPTGQIAGSAKTDLAMGESGVDSTQYVAIQVQITDLDSMKQNTQYGSTITIERQSR